MAIPTETMPLSELLRTKDRGAGRTGLFGRPPAFMKIRSIGENIDAGITASCATRYIDVITPAGEYRSFRYRDDFLVTVTKENDNAAA